MSAAHRVPVLLASPVEAPQAERVAGLDGRVELLYEPDLLPPALFVGDIRGDPSFERGPEGERRFAQMVGRAEVLYGRPGASGEGLAEALRLGPGVRWVQARNAGAGEQVARAVELAPAEMRRVTVTTAAGVHAGPLAEFCLLGLLAFAKGLPELERDRAARSWPDSPRAGRELHGRTLLVVGLGGIGREVARLAHGFGMRILAVRNSPSGQVDGVDEVHPPERLAELAGRADDMVVTLPSTPATRGLVDGEILAALGPRGVFVNVGRGEVVDEAALIERLRDGTLSGAALDVFAREPLPAESPLWTLPNVIVSPHAAALVPAEAERVLQLFVDNLRRYLDGEQLRNAVDPAASY